MDFTHWVSFVATVTILVMTPGPSVLLVTANSMKYGSGKTLGTILGDLSANLCQIVLASVGLASIVISSGELFQIIKWCGVAYLIYMGIMKIITKPEIQLDESKGDTRSFSNLFAEGFLMSAANPKAIVFFAALFPLFISESLPFIPQVAILAITFLVLDGGSLLIYTKFASRLKAFLENQQKVHLQNRIVGVLLIFSGIMLSMVKKSNN
jgi:threonine/homoserine/homoserine lactone efflux protein